MAEHDGSLVVPTTALEVELGWVDEETLSAELFLASPYQTPAELEVAFRNLYQRDPFLAVRETAEGAVLFVNRDHVAWFRVPPEAVPEPDDRLFDGVARTVLSMVGGRTIEGEILYNAPANKARPIDVLNSPGKLVTVIADESMWFVNKALVTRVMTK